MAAKSMVVRLGARPESNASYPKRKKVKYKSGAAVSVAAQARKKSRVSENVESLDRARLKRTKLHISKDLHDIRVEFPGPDREPYVLDLLFLGAAPRLAKPLAEGFRIYGVGKREKTIMGRRFELRGGFLAFLREKSLLEIGLEDIDRSLWNQFKQWLNSKIDLRKGEVIHPKTRATIFGALVATLDSLKSVPQFSRLARTAYDARPSVTWDSIETRTIPRERLPFCILQSIDKAITRDIEALRERVEKSEQLLQTGRERLAAGDPDLFDLATCAAYVAQKYPAGLPSQLKLKVIDPNLHRHVSANHTGKTHGVFAIKELLYPDARDLVPFVIFLAIESGLNPTTLFEMNWSDIDAVEILGERMIRLGGTKWRASEDPLVPIPAARIEPILDVLRRLTRIVRETVNESLKDRLFLFNRIYGTNPAGRGIGSNDRGIIHSDASWWLGLMKFCLDHELQPFTLSQIRATIGDEIAFREGIVVSSQVLGHQNLRTTDNHYVSDGTRWREAEYLGNAMLLRDRWFMTNGKIDPRRRRLTPRMDRGAATPGFYCFDPHDSPWPTQRKGRLCTAYGRCPSCPLAAADIHDPAAVALYQSLRIAIFDAQGRIAGEAWLARYGTVLADLDALLAHVPDDVVELANRFHVTLPPVE